MRRALVVALVLSLAGCASNGPSGAGPSARIGSARGEVAPDFTLTSLDGDIVQLSSLEGQPVFLDFWATWCGPCRKSLPETERLRKEYADSGLQVFTINVEETPEEVKQYLEWAKIEVPVLLDRDGSVSKSYQFGGLPSFFVLDRDHIVRLRITGWGDAGPAMIRGELRAAGVEPEVQSGPVKR